MYVSKGRINPGNRRGVIIRLNCRAITVIILTAFILIPGQFAADFEYRGDYATGDGPHQACTADLDGDGDLDMVTADYNDDAISILINDGEGVFTKEYGYETGNGPRSIFLGDVDGDYDMDCVAGNYFDDTVSVYRNNGDATFAPKADFDSGSGPFSLFLADIKEDSNGDLDIITACEQSSSVSVMVNDGAGSFTNRNSYSVGNKPKGVFLADINNDGYNDIVCVNWADATISILINEKDGTFRKQVKYATGDGPRAVALMDLNGDELPDIACANQHSNSVSVLMNNGDETFSEKVDYHVGANPLSICTGDIDYDSDCDILATSLHNNTVCVLKNDGLGNFNNRRDYITEDGPYSIVFADVNGDEKFDLVTANSFSDSISIHYSHFPSSITVTEPDGLNDMVNHSFLITWEDFYPYGEATIDIFWDEDNNGFDGTKIASGLSEDDDGIGGRFEWNVTSMPEKDYWVYTKIDDSTYEPTHSYSKGPLTVNHSMITDHPPTIQIIEPDGNGDYADSEFTVMWMDSDPDDDARISLHYDNIGYGYNGIFIVDGLGEDTDGGFGFYPWNTTGLMDGNYFIYAIIDDGTNEPQKRYSSFPVFVNHTAFENEAPTINILEPDGANDSAHFEFLIRWRDSDPDDDASISLYYDSDSQGFDGFLIEKGISEDEEGSFGHYEWNTEDIPEGEYFIYAKINDGNNDPVKRYSDYPVIINHTPKNTPPTIEITHPDGSNDSAHTEYLITWKDSDPDEDAEISLYYDDDSAGYDGILIKGGISEDGHGNTGGYFWNTTLVPEGRYWVYARIEDASSEVMYDYSPGPLSINHTPSSNAHPFFQITEPDGANDFADSEFIIMWMDLDPDDDAEISLYFDIDDFGFDGAQIVSGLGEDAHGNLGVYTWNTTNIPEGKYYLYGIIDDGRNGTVKRYSDYQVIVNHTPIVDGGSPTIFIPSRNCFPKIQLVEPDGKNDYATTEYMITWIDADSDDDAFISLFYDSDSTGYDGELIAGHISEDEHGNSGMYIWNISLIPQGHFFIYAIINDGIANSRDYSQGRITISRTDSINYAPRILLLTPQKGLRHIYFNFTILWIDSDSDDDASISLFYDTDQNGYDGTLIVSGLSEDDLTDSFLWNTKVVPDGEYYIYASITDGVNPVVYDYSDGKVAINSSGIVIKEGDEQENMFRDYLFFIILGIAFVLVLLGFVLRRRVKSESEEKEEEDFDEGEADEEDLGVPEDELGKKETNEQEEIDEDLLPPPGDFEK